MTHVTYEELIEIIYKEIRTRPIILLAALDQTGVFVIVEFYMN